MLSFSITLGTTVITQLILLFGGLFLFGILLSFVQEKTQRIYFRVIGWKGILWTAWIGTPIHEIGHLFFAKLFRHKITSVSFFRPNRNTGQLGDVEHSYRKDSLYQNIGNFFIGIAPLISGSLVLIGLLYFLIPNANDVFVPLTGTGNNLLGSVQSIWQTLLSLWSQVDIHIWQWWLFLYLSFAISSHLAPSKQDRRGMWHGLGWIVAVMIILDLLFQLAHWNVTPFVSRFAHSTSVFIGILFYASIISIIHWIAATIILYPLAQLKKR